VAGAGAIQRADGTMEAFIEIDPDNMDFAMSDDWASFQDAGEEFANKELDSKLKLHATTRSFPVEQITENIEDRLNDGTSKKTRSSKNSSRSIERRGRKRCATVESSRCDTTSAFKSPRWRSMTASETRGRRPRS